MSVKLLNMRRRTIYIGIVASFDPLYDRFKKIWIDNIETNTFESKLVNLHFYFLYSDDSIPESRLISHDKYSDYIHANISNTTFPENVLDRTLEFYTFAQKMECDYTMRTNITTMFNISKLAKWCATIPMSNFISGTFNQYTPTIERPLFLSGGNQVLSRDVLLFLINNIPNLNRKLNEDVCVSHFILFNFPNLLLHNPSRLDFVTIGIERHNCEIDDDRTFCFRFKTEDRDYDIWICSNLIKSFSKESFKMSEFIARMEIDKTLGYHPYVSEYF